MNILIIDDEEIILKTVYSQLMEMNLKVDRIDMASSAEEARKMLETYYYDLFLCDIVMPEEDGISFAKWASSHYRHSKIVFLTAHADFSYMKEAIALQSFDYILQPAKKEELKSVVERAMAQISIEEKNRELVARGNFFVDHEQDILEENAMRYLAGFIDEDDYLKELILSRRGSVNAGERYFPVYVQAVNIDDDHIVSDRNLLRSIYYNVLEELTEALNTKIVILLKGLQIDDFLFLMSFEEGRSQDIQPIIEKLESIRILFDRMLYAKVAIYCGRFCNFNEIRSVCQEIEDDMLSNAKVTSRLYRVGQLSSLTADGYSFESEFASWKSLVNQKRLTDFKKSVFNYIDFYTSGNEVSRDYMLKIHRSISELILGFIANNEVDSNLVFDGKMSYYDFVYSWNSVESLKNAIGYIIDKLCTLTDVPDDDIIQDTIRFIRQNIDLDLSVNEIADRAGMNPEYYTRLFKKETGMNLKRFIINEKIEAAKILLTTTNLPVTIISGHVGYANYGNFSRGFKQVVGLTPSEYQKLNKPGKE